MRNWFARSSRSVWVKFIYAAVYHLPPFRAYNALHVAIFGRATHAARRSRSVVKEGAVGVKHARFRREELRTVHPPLFYSSMPWCDERPVLKPVHASEISRLKPGNPGQPKPKPGGRTIRPMDNVCGSQHGLYFGPILHGRWPPREEAVGRQWRVAKPPLWAGCRLPAS